MLHSSAFLPHQNRFTNPVGNQLPVTGGVVFQQRLHHLRKLFPGKRGDFQLFSVQIFHSVDLPVKKCLEKVRCYWMRFCSRSGTVLFRMGWLYPIRSASGEGSATPSKEFTWTQRQTVQFVSRSVTVNRNPNPKRRQNGPKWRAL